MSHGAARSAAAGRDGCSRDSPNHLTTRRTSILEARHVDGRGHCPKGRRRKDDSGAASRCGGRQERPGDPHRHRPAGKRGAVGRSSPRIPADGGRLADSAASAIAAGGTAKRRPHRLHRYRAGGRDPCPHRRTHGRLLSDRVAARRPRSPVDRHQRADREARGQTCRAGDERGAGARRPGGRSLRACRQRLRRGALSIVIHQRAVFSHALAKSLCAQEAEPASKAATEIAALWDWLARRTNIFVSPVRLSA